MMIKIHYKNYIHMRNSKILQLDSMISLFSINIFNKIYYPNHNYYNITTYFILYLYYYNSTPLKNVNNFENRSPNLHPRSEKSTPLYAFFAHFIDFYIKFYRKFDFEFIIL